MTGHTPFSALRTRNVITPQSEPIPESGQVPNAAGGYSWLTDKWVQLDRFLILGTTGGSYYITEKKLTKENYESIRECIDEDAFRTVARAVDFSVHGRAVKNDQAIFIIAATAAHASLEGRQRAFGAVEEVCRTVTHLVQFVEYFTLFRGWGRGLRRAVGEWFHSKTYTQLTYQLAKYQSRNGWATKDLLRLSHPKAKDDSYNELFRWAVGKGKIEGGTIAAMELVHSLPKDSTSSHAVVDAIKGFGLTREMIPTEFLNDPMVWDALLTNMPLHAMVRNLGNMSKVGLLAPMSERTEVVVRKLENTENVHKSRLHPMSLLKALATYRSGKGVRGSGEWTVNPQVVVALEDAVKSAFDSIVPTGKRILVGVDRSGSMGAPCSLNEHLTCSQVAAVMALVLVSTETQTLVVDFDTAVQQSQITKNWSISSALHHGNAFGGGTDISLPVRYALANNVPVDAFIILTDSESWAGSIHLQQLLEHYRKEMGIQAKLINVQMAANRWKNVSPVDQLTLECNGFDTSVPSVISEFIKL